MSARATATGTISFGLVSIPIKFYTAASPQAVSFNLIHAKCGGRVKQEFRCPTDDEVVERAELARGFEHARDQFVVFSDEEMKNLESDRANELELVEFVPASTVDLLYLEKSYYVGPDKGGERAYRLLAESMLKTGQMAVGRQIARGRDQLAIVRPRKDGKGLVLHQVFYATEVRDFADVPIGGDVEFTPSERALAEKLIRQLKKPAFAPERFADEYQGRVAAAVAKKIEGKEIVVATRADRAQIVDLSEALKQSLAKTKGDARHGKKSAAA